MQTFESAARDRGVATIPQELRERARIAAGDPLSWVELRSDLWLVGPKGSPESFAPLLEALLLSGQSRYPKLVKGVLTGEISLVPREVQRHYTPTQEPPALTEEQMIALGSAREAPRRRPRGRE